MSDTEETKPVEREAAVALSVAYNAGWDAALERAAQIAEDHNEEHFAKPDAGVYRNCGVAIAIQIRALKGRE